MRTLSLPFLLCDTGHPNPNLSYLALYLFGSDLITNPFARITGFTGSVPGSTDRNPMADVESNPGAGGKPPLYKDPDNGSKRFLLELEFVQCLANPTYIHCTVLSSVLLFHLTTLGLANLMLHASMELVNVK
jgi:hypothetical protein